MLVLFIDRWFAKAEGMGDKAIAIRCKAAVHEKMPDSMLFRNMYTDGEGKNQTKLFCGVCAGTLIFSTFKKVVKTQICENKV